ncbi:hypothetical protein Tco_0477831 [Tanacetum coccineum]
MLDFLKKEEVSVIDCYSNLEAGLLERFNGPDHIISTGPYRTILHGKIFGKDHQLRRLPFCFDQNLGVIDFWLTDYDQRVQNLHGDEDIRDVHALTSPYYPHSMATSDRASRGDFSNMSVTNSTLVLAGSSIASSTVENDGASNWDYGLHPSITLGRKLRFLRLTTEKSKRSEYEAGGKEENDDSKTRFKKAEERESIAEAEGSAKLLGGS